MNSFGDLNFHLNIYYQINESEFFHVSRTEYKDSFQQELCGDICVIVFMHFSFQLIIFFFSTQDFCQAICTQRTPKGPK